MMKDFIKNGIRFFVKNQPGEDPVGVIKRVLETDSNVDFLLELKTMELENLAACIRDRIGQVGN